MPQGFHFLRQRAKAEPLLCAGRSLSDLCFQIMFRIHRHSGWLELLAELFQRLEARPSRIRMATLRKGVRLILASIKTQKAEASLLIIPSSHGMRDIGPVAGMAVALAKA